MHRKQFLSVLCQGAAGTLAGQQQAPMEPEKRFFEDDGRIPNNRLPVLIYRQVFTRRNQAGADWLEALFARNNWTNAWRNGIFSYHHYHSTSHEVLGIYAGEALLHLGGEQGDRVAVQAGDVLVLPAGVGHKNLGSKELGVVGAYPDGRNWDINRGEPGERPRADEHIAALPVPGTDPLFGKGRGLPLIWK